MKKYLLMLIIPLITVGQSHDQNYTITTDYKIRTSQEVNDNDKTKVNIIVTYYDGLGRPCLKAEHQQSNDDKTLFLFLDYDGYGRESRTYFPYKGNDDINFDTSALQNTMNFYTAYGEATTNPYTEKFFLNNPLQEVRKISAPGNDWADVPDNGPDHTVKFEKDINVDEDFVKQFTISTTLEGKIYETSLDEHGYYPKGDLIRFIIKNENWVSGSKNTGVEFRNAKGQTILKRSYDEGEKFDTYYVYDQYDNLSFVIPPKATNPLATLDDLCFQYKYDTRNRLVAKKLPGKRWEFIIYDRVDRPVMTGPVLSPFGDSSLGWMVTKYDSFSRVAYLVFFPFNSEQDFYDNQDIYDQAIAINETKAGSNVDNIDNIWSSTVFPTGAYKLLSINYYDDYNFPNGPSVIPSAIKEQNVQVNVKGQQTGKWVRALTSPAETFGETVYTFFDRENHPVRSYSQNYLGGFTQVDTFFNFFGQPLNVETTHKRINSQNPIVTIDEYTYTAQDRLLTHLHKVDNEDVQLITHNTYDALGRVKTKNIGGNDILSFDGLQKVDFHYNVRGWLKGINNVNALNSPHDPTDLFALEINYNQPQDETPDQSGDETPKMYNGNISELYWRSLSDNVLRKYAFEYDAMSRLRAATYQKPDLLQPITHAYDEVLSYDPNGNIAEIYRTGTLDDANAHIDIDELKYFYAANSNKLMKVTDVTNNPNGFLDDSNGTVENDNTDDYSYDDLGNIKTDENKKIDSIVYNHFNLPTEIDFRRFRGGNISYLYDAEGNKLKKVVNESDMMVQGGIKTTVTDYLDGFQYVNNNLTLFPHSEGYVNVITRNDVHFYSYAFNYYDHLGNIRMTWGFDAKTNGVKILDEMHYYPYGLRHQNYNTDERDFKKEEEILKPIVVARAIGGTAEKKLYKYKYNGKEWQDELALNLYDYGARNYDPAIGRWVNIDNLSEKYRNSSPYHYAGNNPVINFDVDGNQFTSSMANWVGSLRSRTRQTMESNSQQIQDYLFRKSNQTDDVNKREEYAKKANELAKANNEFSNVLCELDVLERSSQVYDVVTDDSRSNDFVTTNGTGFNFKNGRVEIYVSSGDKTTIGLFAHEAHHAYQFEIGENSIGEIRDVPYGSLFYDKQDEVDAYNRGHLYGEKTYTINNLPGYGYLPAGPYSMNNVPGVYNNIGGPNQKVIFQRMAKALNQAFRINGVTYYTKSTKQ